MAKIILNYHPPLELRDGSFDGTPLGWAIYGSENGWNAEAGDYAGTVETLIAAGAKLPATITGTEAVRDVLRRQSANESQP